MPGCSHIQRGGETPEEFRAVHSAPECSHLVSPMLGPVRAHLLGLFKCSGRMCENTGKMKNQSSVRISESGPHSSLSLALKRKEPMRQKEKAVTERPALGLRCGAVSCLCHQRAVSTFLRAGACGPAANLG